MRRTCPGPFETCYVMKCADEEVPCRVGVRKRVLYPVLEEGALSPFIWIRMYSGEGHSRYHDVSSLCKEAGLLNPEPFSLNRTRRCAGKQASWPFVLLGGLGSCAGQHLRHGEMN